MTPLVYCPLPILAATQICIKNHQILLANSPDWPEAEPLRENLLVSLREYGQKQVPGPTSPNYKETHSLPLSPYRDFANSIRLCMGK
jgi:hypothetical protein